MILSLAFLARLHLHCYFLDCQTGAIDLVFVLDTSLSVTHLYEKLQQLVANISSVLDIGLEDSLVGVITYGTDTIINFNLMEHTDKSMLVSAFGNLTAIGGVTNTHLALKLLLGSAQNGRMGLRNKVPHAAIILTDGKSTSKDAMLRQANRLHDANIYHVMAAGIGDADVKELNKIATSPSFVFFTSNTDAAALQQLQQNITQRLCKCKSLFY